MRKLLIFLLVIYFTFTMTTMGFAHEDDIPKIYSIEEPVGEN
jgi:hypothetical protein